MNVRNVDKNTTRRVYVHLKTSGTANLTGGSPTVTIIRKSDGYFWNGSTFAALAASEFMSELNATNAPGIYYYDFAIPDAFEEYLIYIDGTASATYIRYHSETWRAGVTAESAVGHNQDQVLTTGVVTIYDSDGSTAIATITPGKDVPSNPTKSTTTVS